MAGRILQAREIIGKPATCDFCAALSFERPVVFDRCKRYNAQAHVKKAHAYSGVRIVNYILDSRHCVFEKRSKIFQFRFCPVCGYDYYENKEYDGNKYNRPVNINNAKNRNDSDA